MRAFFIGEESIFMKKYEIIDHTADIGIDINGRIIQDIFIHSAEGMFAIMTGNSSIIAREDFSGKIKLNAEDLEDLLVAWLNELLYISETKWVVLTGFNIKKLSNHHIEADIEGTKIHRTNLKIEKEIKAVTYHQLAIEKDSETGLWRARVIFDI